MAFLFCNRTDFCSTYYNRPFLFVRSHSSSVFCIFLIRPWYYTSSWGCPFSFYYNKTSSLAEVYRKVFYQANTLIRRNSETLPWNSIFHPLTHALCTTSGIFVLFPWGMLPLHMSRVTGACPVTPVTTNLIMRVNVRTSRTPQMTSLQQIITHSLHSQMTSLQIHHTQLANMTFDEIFDLTAGGYLFFLYDIRLVVDAEFSPINPSASG